jgi:hypothetical protein
MMDAPPIVLSPELIAHMRDHPDGELSRFARGYIELALMLGGETHLSNLEPGEGRQLTPRLSVSEMVELTRDLQTINEKLEAMIAEARSSVDKS